MSFKNELICTSDQVNLYDILGLDMTEVRKLNIGDQKKTIKRAFRDQIKIWHPDKNCGDGEFAMKIIEAKKILLDDERRAQYHNEADYNNGWFSLKRYKSIFWPDCYTEKQNGAYWRRVTFVAALCGFTVASSALFSLSPVVYPVVCGAAFGRALYVRAARTTEKSLDDSVENETYEFYETSEEEIAEEPQKATQCKPNKPHVETSPPERTFTSNGELGRESVTRVSDECDKETGATVGYIQQMNLNSAGEYSI